MMFQWLKKQFTPEQKSYNQTFGDFIVYGMEGNPNGLDVDVMYRQIAMAFYCVEKIATTADSVPLRVVDKSGKEIKNHPMLKLIEDKTLFGDGGSLKSSSFRDLKVFGRAYGLRMPYGDRESKNVNALQRIIPTRVSPQFSRGMDIATSFQVTFNSNVSTHNVDLMNGYCDLLNFGLYSSNSYVMGLSPMMVASKHGKLVDNGLNWNINLLKNSGRPSGILAPKDGGVLDVEQQIRLEQVIKSQFDGAKNAGKTIIPPVNMTYTAISGSPKELDFLGQSQQSDKAICHTFGVPLQLVFEGASTYDNYVQATETFITYTVMPLVQDFLDTYNLWYKYATGDDSYIEIDKDNIAGLENKRVRQLDASIKALGGIKTPNEIRESLGLEKISEPMADSLFIPSNLTPLELIDVGSMNDIAQSNAPKDTKVK